MTPTNGAPKPATGAITKAAPVALAGGIGALLMSLLQSNPAIIAQVSAWGPAFVFLIAAVWLVDRHVPPFVDAQRQIAGSLAALSSTVSQRIGEEDDVRLAVRTLSAQIERNRDEMRVDIRELGKMIAANGGKTS